MQSAPVMGAARQKNQRCLARPDTSRCKLAPSRQTVLAACFVRHSQALTISVFVLVSD
ncbi:MAG: hypothetical protein JWR65_2997 [Massilia sp.]|nr:hypothetical protein [Massilia sp.]